MGSLVASPGGLQSTGSIIVVHRLSYSAECEIFLKQGSHRSALAEADSLREAPQRDILKKPTASIHCL